MADSTRLRLLVFEVAGLLCRNPFSLRGRRAGELFGQFLLLPDLASLKAIFDAIRLS